MSTLIFKNAFVSIGGTDLSGRVQEVAIDQGHETQDPTMMGANTRLVKGGLKTWTVSITFGQDFAASQVDAVLSAIHDANPPEAALEIRPDAGAVGPTNPKWTGTGVLTNYTPLSGAVGDFLQAPVTFEAGSDLVRATS